MAVETKCDTCKGKGGYDALISMHDDETEWTTCHTCYGKGVIYVMTEQEEEDYKHNNDF